MCIISGLSSYNLLSHMSIIVFGAIFIARAHIRFLRMSSDANEIVEVLLLSALLESAVCSVTLPTVFGINLKVSKWWELFGKHIPQFPVEKRFEVSLKCSLCVWCLYFSELLFLCKTFKITHLLLALFVYILLLDVSFRRLKRAHHEYITHLAWSP